MADLRGKKYLLTPLEEDGYKELQCVSNCIGSAWLIRGVGQYGKPDGDTYVALHAPYAPECATAVLKVDLLPSVEFGVNSWRGDHWHKRIKELHNAAHS